MPQHAKQRRNHSSQSNQQISNQRSSEKWLCLNHVRKRSLHKLGYCSAESVSAEFEPSAPEGVWVHGFLMYRWMQVQSHGSVMVHVLIWLSFKGKMGRSLVLSKKVNVDMFFLIKCFWTEISWVWQRSSLMRFVWNLDTERAAGGLAAYLCSTPLFLYETFSKCPSAPKCQTTSPTSSWWKILPT